MAGGTGRSVRRRDGKGSRYKWDRARGQEKRMFGELLQRNSGESKKRLDGGSPEVPPWSLRRKEEAQRDKRQIYLNERTMEEDI